MKCPLLQRYLIEGENKALEVFDDCLKEECAWWEGAGKRCAVLSLSRQLWLLVGDASMPAEKIAAAGK